MSKNDKSCFYVEEDQLSGGKSGDKVTLVRNPITNELLVKKTSQSGDIPTEQGLSERDAFVISRDIFKGPNTLINETNICTKCFKEHGEKGCNISQFIDGVSLNEILLSSVSQAQTHRLELVEVMEKNGYFKQHIYRLSNIEWWKLLSLPKFIKFYNTIAQLQQNDDEEIFSNGINLANALAEALEILTNNKKTVPNGFFPSDLNVSNIFVTDNEIKLIDQTMVLTDPVAVAVKLFFGWRKLGIVDTTSSLTSKVNEFKAEQKQIENADNEFIESIQNIYPEYKTFRKRLFAALLIRHIRGLYSMRIKYKNDSQLPEAEKIIAQYISKALTEIEE